jgi:hypothetical protein
LSGCSQSPVEEAIAASDVDIDFSTMTAEAIGKEFYKMKTEPDTYVGKTVRAKGPYLAIFDEEVGRYCHLIFYEDAAGCCQEYMEFMWSGDRVYPDDYPEEGTIVELVGVFDYYTIEIDEFFVMNCPYLNVDEVVFLTGQKTTELVTFL